MKSDRKSGSSRSAFLENLPSNFVLPDDPVELILLREYGAVFVANGGVVVPKAIVFKDSLEVSRFQEGLRKSTRKIGGFDLVLQSPAMNALQKAIREAARQNLAITPRDIDSASRTYDETVSLWASRVDPALMHWAAKGQITEKDVNRIRSRTPFEQVSEVLKLEEKGIYFAKDLSKSIIYSVAPPGASQHLTLLAFDISEHENLEVRTILASEGWYQTVISDLPHFTYLGAAERELPGFGLKKISRGARIFWVPDI